LKKQPEGHRNGRCTKLKGSRGVGPENHHYKRPGDTRYRTRRATPSRGRNGLHVRYIQRETARWGGHETTGTGKKRTVREARLGSPEMGKTETEVKKGGKINCYKNSFGREAREGENGGGFKRAESPRGGETKSPILQRQKPKKNQTQNHQTPTTNPQKKKKKNHHQQKTNQKQIRFLPEPKMAAPYPQNTRQTCRRQKTVAGKRSVERVVKIRKKRGGGEDRGKKGAGKPLIAIDSRRGRKRADKCVNGMGPY